MLNEQFELIELLPNPSTLLAIRGVRFSCISIVLFRAKTLSEFRIHRNVEARKVVRAIDEL